MPSNVLPFPARPTPDPSRQAGLRLSRLRQRLGLSQEQAAIECPAIGSLKTLRRMELARVAMTQLRYLAWLEERVAEVEAAEAGRVAA